MIAKDQRLEPAKFPHHLRGPVFWAEEAISRPQYVVPRLNRRIVALYQRSVVLLGAEERALCVITDSTMTEMRIAVEVGEH